MQIHANSAMEKQLKILVSGVYLFYMVLIDCFGWVGHTEIEPLRPSRAQGFCLPVCLFVCRVDT